MGKLAGLALAQTDERDRAATELQHAARAFERCGAVRYRNEAERDLRKLGHRIYRRTRPGTADGIGLESLTERELQVARLVVDRKTNPEIASELFLSQKTVAAGFEATTSGVMSRLTKTPAPSQFFGRDRAF